MAAKSGRVRKAKRNLRKNLETDISVALGTHWEAKTPAEEAANNALIKKATRWLTDAPLGELQEDAEDFTQLSAREIAMVMTRRNMISPDPDVSNSAIRNLLAMEQQNQADQHHITPTGDGMLAATGIPEEYANAEPDKLIEARQMLVDMKKPQKGKS